MCLCAHKPSSRRLGYFACLSDALNARTHTHTDTHRGIEKDGECTFLKAFVHMNKYIGVEDHFSTRYAIIFAIGVNNDHKQTNNNYAKIYRLNDEPAKRMTKTILFFFLL